MCSRGPIGTYGNFEIMPMFCPDGFNSCNVTLATRERFRKNNTDVRFALAILDSIFDLMSL